MKRLFILATVVTMAISTTGCGRHQRMWCQPTEPTCDPCGDATTFDGGMMIPDMPATLPPSLPGPIMSEG
jgi:hypothetical protein